MCRFAASIAHRAISRRFTFSVWGASESRSLERVHLSPTGVDKADSSHGMYGSAWFAMYTVNALKFAPGSEMARLLLETGEDFLLNHISEREKEKIWSNNNNGEGSNWSECN